MALDQNFLKAKNTIIRTFDLVPKSVPTTFGARSKLFKAKNTIIKTFDLVPKVASSFLAQHRKFLNWLNWYLWLFLALFISQQYIQSTVQSCQFLFWHLIKSFKKPKILLLQLLILCQKRTCNFWHKIESFWSQKYHYQNFQSSAKIGTYNFCH